MKKNFPNFPVTIITSVILVISCAKKEGCTNPNASNFDKNAEIDNGSCVITTITDDTTSLCDCSSSGEINKTANTFTDTRDGNTYKTVTIGKQVWMAENLKYLPKVNKVADGSEDAPGSYYYVYGYDGTDVSAAKVTCNYKNYGVLYNWTAAMDGSVGSESNPKSIKGVCPTGWHLPSTDEWNELLVEANDYTIGNNSLKSTTCWYNDGNGNDKYGFNALPGGNRYGELSGSVDGYFYNISKGGYWWTSNECGNMCATYKRLFYDESYFYTTGDKRYSFSVRCVKD